MRAPAVSFAKRFAAALLAALLTFTLLPAFALAEGEDANSTVGESQEAGSAQVDEAAEANAPEGAESNVAVSAPLASMLAGAPTAFVNVDVALNGEPVVGSFTVDGLTFAVADESTVELVGVSEAAGASPRRVVAESQGLSAPLALPDLGSTPAASETEADGSMSETRSPAFVLPESVTYGDVEYAVNSIGAYVFYLSGVTSVELPASVIDVDDRAFRSSDVASVEVAEGNASYSSFDGALYDADQSSLLLIPEGKQGTVLLPKEAESAAPSVFSHCPLVTQISVEEGSAAFASENGLLYDASLETLLRVPAGATDITIREGCTTIAAGAMEACASLATINAPASVTSISPDVFTSVPTVSLPAVFIADDGAEGEAETSDSTSTQLTALVALSSADNDRLEVDIGSIKVIVSEESDVSAWMTSGFSVSRESKVQVSAEDDGDAYFADTRTGSVARASASEAWICAPNDTRYYYDSNDTTNIQLIQDDAYRFNYHSGHVVHDYRYDGAALWTDYLGNRSYYGVQGLTPDMKGIDSVEYSYDRVSWYALGSSWTRLTGVVYFSLNGARDRYPVTLDNQGAQDAGTESVLPVNYEAMPPIVVPKKNGLCFYGYWTQLNGQGECFYAADGSSAKDAFFTQASTLYAYWKPLSCDISFDTSSEPEDEDYPGIEKPNQTVVGEQIEAGDKVEIENPKRPGYVFQGWTIPNTEGTEAIDQDLVYQDETDGKWYVDASKLPDYADDSGRVELTARWTSVISVDVPSAVTFYADVVTEGQESREGAASSAFGQNKVASQSEVDLRIVGLESSAVETQGSTLGADSILKKATSATPSSSTQKLFSLYPTSKALTPDDLQDPDAVSATKPADAVDFALDDILLEKSFAVDKFTIPAGDTLNLGYRLNLFETGTELDYDKLSTLEEGQSASIATISYCFAAEDITPAVWDEPLWVKNDNPSLGRAGYHGLEYIKQAADDIAIEGEASAYYEEFKGYLDNATIFHLRFAPAPSGYIDLQLIGLAQDVLTTSVGGRTKAGLTFQTKEDYAGYGAISTAAGGGSFSIPMNTSATNATGWASSNMRTWLRSTFMGYIDQEVQEVISKVTKYQQLPGSNYQRSTNETIWLPSAYEVYGKTFSNYNPTESSSAIPSDGKLQYQWFEKGGNGQNNTYAIKKLDNANRAWYLRSAYSANSSSFCTVGTIGTLASHSACDGAQVPCIAPCFAL